MRYHPIYNALAVGGRMIGDHMNNLRGEYAALPSAMRRKWYRRYLIRRIVLLLTGQAMLQRKTIPSETRRMLWIYDWSTIGDAIMDLSQRFAIPANITIDVCMPYGAAALFEGDERFNHIYRDIRDCPDNYDFILLHDIGPRSIRFKLAHFFSTPWASTLNYQHGEQYARLHFSAWRFEQLLNDVIAPLHAPLHLPLHRPRISRRGIETVVPHTGVIAVALGSIDARRQFRRWASLLTALRDLGMTRNLPFRFMLIGSGAPAREDLAQLPTPFVEQCCDVQFDLPNLMLLKQQLARAQFFLGCDSGLMHMAEALDVPGIGLFGGIKPEWRLLPSSQIMPLYSSENVNEIAIPDIVSAFTGLLDAA